MKQLIEDLISAMEYHVEQTRPIHSTTVALQAAKEALKAQPTPVQEPVWIQPDHLQKAQTAPFLCRVEPHKRDDFVPLYTAPPAQPKPVQEPVGEWAESRSSSNDAKRIAWKPGYVVSAKVGDKIYTTPPAAPVQPVENKENT
jgi:hypothetical protein